ncbi:OsmC family protein [bacterium]|nr:OsmC family protein [bacterium]
MRKIKGITFAGLGETGHWVILDTDKKYDGSEGAAKPMEMILMGLGGCSGMDILSILKKMHIDVLDFEIRIQAVQADEHPRIFTKIDIEYVFGCDEVDIEKLEKAIRLSHEKYCPVMAMFKEDVQINYSYKVKNALNQLD